MSSPGVSSPDVLLDTDARGIATLALARPERGNAYTPAMLADLGEALGRLARDPAVRLLVLRGTGKHFCVGADIGTAAPAPRTDPPVGLSEVCHALDTFAKPTVALVHGACIGGGAALVACCDVVLAEKTAFFSIPEVRIGFSPGPIAPFFLRAIGARQLRRYGLTGERFPAAEAHRIGLVHQLEDSVSGPDALGPIADSLLLGAPGAQAEFKQTLAEVQAEPATPALLQRLQARFDERKGSPEAAEGRAAFAGKRKPHWYPAPP